MRREYSWMYFPSFFYNLHLQSIYHVGKESEPCGRNIIDVNEACKLTHSTQLLWMKIHGESDVDLLQVIFQHIKKLRARGGEIKDMKINDAVFRNASSFTFHPCLVVQPSLYEIFSSCSFIMLHSHFNVLFHLQWKQIGRDLSGNFAAWWKKVVVEFLFRFLVSVKF